MPEELAHSSAEHIVKHRCKLLSHRAFSADAKVNTSPEFKGIKTCAVCAASQVLQKVNTSPEFKGIKTCFYRGSSCQLKSKYQP